MKRRVAACSRELYTQYSRGLVTYQDELPAELTSGESHSRQAEWPEQRPGVGHRQGQLDSLWPALPGLRELFSVGAGVATRRDEEGSGL